MKDMDSDEVMGFWVELSEAGDDGYEDPERDLMLKVQSCARQSIAIVLLPHKRRQRGTFDRDQGSIPDTGLPVHRDETSVTSFKWEEMMLREVGRRTSH